MTITGGARRWRAALAAALLLAAAERPAAFAGDRLAASDGAPELLLFDSDDPQHATAVPLVGLADGETVLGLDMRPLTGELYLLGSTSRVYVVNPATGTCTPVGTGPFAPILNGRAHGFDFNPTVDRIRVTTDVDQNLRVIPGGLAGEGTVAAVDGMLAYPVDDAGFGFDPRVAASAYDNNDDDPATGTTLYDVDTERDVLARQAPPNDGTLVTIGPLGDDFEDAVGFDVAPNGNAWAVMHSRPHRASRLYAIDLLTGQATLVGRIRGGRTLTSLAVLF
jgi:hypothetical protein